MRRFLSTLAVVSLASSSLLLATGTTVIPVKEVTPIKEITPVKKESVVVEKESIDEIVLSSFRDNNHSMYTNGVVPSYEEFVHIRETMTGRKVDPNRSKMRYFRKLDGITKNWDNVAQRIQRHGINWDDVKLIDVTHEIDQATTDKLKKEASRVTYLNFSHKDQAFSIAVRSCFNLDGWKCGGKLRFAR